MGHPKYNTTERARRFVCQSQTCKFFEGHARDNLIKGIARLLSEAYKQGKADAESKNDS